MMKYARLDRFLLTLCLTLSCIHVNAQAPLFRWELDIVPEEFNPPSHITTLDGGTLLMVQTRHTQTGNFYFNMIKMDVTGTVQWHKRFSVTDRTFGNVVQAPDSGYFFCCVDDLNFTAYVITKTDKNGNVVFSKRLNLTSPYQVVKPGKVMAKNDGGVYLLSSVVNNAVPIIWHLVDISANGTVLMSNCYYGGYGYCYATDIDTCANGDIMLLGTVVDTIQGVLAPGVMRLNQQGQMIWGTAYHTAIHSLDAISFSKGAGDVFYINSHGISVIPVQTLSVVVMKIDGYGNLHWSNRYHDAPRQLQPYESQTVENDNVVVIASHYLLKIDPTGLLITSRYDGDIKTWDMDTLAGRYTFSGHGDYNDPAIFYTSDQNLETCSDTAATIFTTALTGSHVSITGLTPLPLTSVTHTWTTATATLLTDEKCNSVGLNDLKPQESITLYPVPASDAVTIQSGSVIDRVQIFDCTGKLMIDEVPVTSTCTIQLSHLAAGVYICSTEQNGKVTRHKLIVD